MKTKVIALLMIAVMVLNFAGCAAQKAATSEEKTIVDRNGNKISLPPKFETVLAAGPSVCEILDGLGLSDKIVAADTYSKSVKTLGSDTIFFDMITPNVEEIVELNPDIIFVIGMAQGGGDDTYKPFADAGICVVEIPSATSIAEIKDDIRFVAEVMGVPSKSEKLIGDIEKEIADLKAIGDTITDKKSVYFEISAAPQMYSFGSGVFMDEMLGIIGAKNVFADQKAWISVTDESILAANPDVILTSVDYVDDATGEIKSRPGWDVLSAVKNNAVYFIDPNVVTRPSQNFVIGLKDMAKAVYPDKFM